jgi:hypothetical protein
VKIDNGEKGFVQWCEIVHKRCVVSFCKLQTYGEAARMHGFISKNKVVPKISERKI